MKLSSLALITLVFNSAISGAAVPPKTDAVEAGPLKIGKPAFAGTGCPVGQTTAKVRPDSEDADVTGEVKSNAAQAGGPSAATALRTCNLALPVEVPAGFQAALAGARFEGAYQLPSGAKAVLRTEHAVVGGSGLKREQRLVASANALSGTFENELNLDDVVWTSCAGGAFNLRSNLSVALTNPSRLTAATFGFGAPESKTTELKYKVEWRKCRQ